jgi:hypothetical protein
MQAIGGAICIALAALAAGNDDPRPKSATLAPA